MQNNNTRRNQNNSNNNIQPFRVLICGGGVSGLVFAHFLLNGNRPAPNKSITTLQGDQAILTGRTMSTTIIENDEYSMPIEVTLVEKATRYAQVGALITVDGK